MNQLIQNLNTAKDFLFNAIQYKHSEEFINKYIKFMDSLDNSTKEFILLNNGITTLINKINRGV